MGKTVLIVEDETPIVDILTFNLAEKGYTVFSCSDGESGLNRARELNPDLILLDVMLPGMDGFAICSALRKEGFSMPILMLTAREDESDKVFGLEAGADDYITKPFSMRELLARVGANIRRTAADSVTAGQLFVFGDISLHSGRMEVARKGAPLQLSQREYDLLLFLMKHPDQVFSREQLMEHVWNYEYYGDLRAVDVAVRRLREKIEDAPSEPVLLVTRRGAGYLLSSGIMTPSEG